MKVSLLLEDQNVSVLNEKRSSSLRKPGCHLIECKKIFHKIPEVRVTEDQKLIEEALIED